MYNNLYQPNYNQATPYVDRLNALQGSFNNRYEITKVNGQNGANAFNLPPNSSVLLLDETQPIVWLKSTDGAGYPTITPYKIEPYQAEQQTDYKSLEERISRIEAILIEQSNFTKSQSTEQQLNVEPIPTVQKSTTRKKSTTNTPTISE